MVVKGGTLLPIVINGGDIGPRKKWPKTHRVSLDSFHP